MYSSDGGGLRARARVSSRQYDTNPAKYGSILQASCIQGLTVVTLVSLMQGKLEKSDQPLNPLMLLRESGAVQDSRSHHPISTEQFQQVSARMRSAPGPRSALGPNVFLEAFLTNCRLPLTDWFPQRFSNFKYVWQQLLDPVRLFAKM